MGIKDGRIKESTFGLSKALLLSPSKLTMLPDSMPQCQQVSFVVFFHGRDCQVQSHPKLYRCHNVSTLTFILFYISEQSSIRHVPGQTTEGFINFIDWSSFDQSRVI